MTAKQKKFAALAEPKDKITYADKIAGATKKDIEEGILDFFKGKKKGKKKADDKVSTPAKPGRFTAGAASDDLFGDDDK
jgi:hypothetical protein